MVDHGACLDSEKFSKSNENFSQVGECRFFEVKNIDKSIWGVSGSLGTIGEGSGKIEKFSKS